MTRPDLRIAPPVDYDDRPMPDESDRPIRAEGVWLLLGAAAAMAWLAGLFLYGWLNP